MNIIHSNKNAKKNIQTYNILFCKIIILSFFFSFSSIKNDPLFIKLQ